MNGRQEGFTIIEVVISMVMLALILTTLAGFTFVTARQAVVATDRAHQQALKLELVNRYSALPWDSLTNGYSRTDQAGSTNNLVERKVTITRSGTTATVVIVTRALQRRVTVDTVRLTRAAPASPNPLCIGC